MEGTLSATAHVLVIDDDASMARMMAMSLRTQGFTVKTAANGVEALEQIAREKPDAIVLDLAMPVMDGRTFYRELRARGNATPVLVVSAYGARSASLELQAQGFMPKPFHPDELGEKVQRLLEVGA